MIYYYFSHYLDEKKQPAKLSGYLWVSFLFFCGFLNVATLFADEITIPINVTAEDPQNEGLINGIVIDGDYLDGRRLMTNDTATLLDGVSGVSFYSGGGVSSLPVIDGLADDRIKIKIDGMPITSACANHMNPTLSYIDPSAVGKINIFAGITPVSQGGDSIAGSISVESKNPEFSVPGQGNIVKGSLSSFYRSNGNVLGASANVSFTSENFSMSYSGNTVESDNYEDGNGDDVKSTKYKVRNNLLNIATRSGDHHFGIHVGWQDIPYQAYVNQAMDMTGNQGVSFNVNYEGHYDWGVLESRVYRQRVRHSMDKLSDKGGSMPMEALGIDTGYFVQGSIELSQRDLLRVGHEYHHYTLDDWWPPVSLGMMSPNTFWNINDGKRDRLALFGEIDSKWNDQWRSQIGTRLERVYMRAGDVQGYNNMSYGSDANSFNEKDHKKLDYNLDITATSQFEPNKIELYEFGFSRKVRSPNIHERFTWSTEMMMAGLMNNWLGDLNSYVGNLDLDPEVAYTLKLSGNWHDQSRKDWQVKLTPFYTYVEDFINVRDSNYTTANMSGGGKELIFVNHDAYLYGINASGKKYLGNLNGEWTSRASISYVRGKSTTGTNLYNIMPLNAKFSLDHSLGSWTNTAEVVTVTGKDDVDSVRGESEVPGYTIANFKTSYNWNDTVRLEVGIDNILDKQYNLPLGGIEYKGVNQYNPTRGMGRSANIGMTINF